MERRRFELFRQQHERSLQSDDIVYNAQYVQAQMSSINLHSNRAVVNDDETPTRSMQPINPPGELSTARKRRVRSQVSNPAKCIY